MKIADDRLTDCRRCGRRVMFITTHDGRKVPLDPVATVYHRIKDPENDNHFWLREASNSSFAAHECQDEQR